MNRVISSVVLLLLSLTFSYIIVQGSPYEIPLLDSEASVVANEVSSAINTLAFDSRAGAVSGEFVLRFTSAGNIRVNVSSSRISVVVSVGPFYGFSTSSIRSDVVVRPCSVEGNVIRIRLSKGEIILSSL